MRAVGGVALVGELLISVLASDTDHCILLRVPAK